MSTIEEEQEPNKPIVFRIIALCVALLLIILVALIVTTTQVFKSNKETAQDSTLEFDTENSTADYWTERDR